MIKLTYKLKISKFLKNHGEKAVINKMEQGYLAQIIFLILISISLLLLPNIVLAQATKDNSTPIQYDFGKQYRIQSKILGEERKLLIYVPEEYQESTDRFPVVYLLEGQIHYKHATIAVEKIQKTGWMPASIIVAITDNKDTNSRDYINESDKFINFIDQEVQAFVGSNFRVNRYKTIFGHGVAGTFLLNAFIDKPDGFDNYIIANPFSLREPLLTRFENLLDKNETLDQSLYFSVGTVLDNGSYNVEPVEALADLLQKKAPKSLQWTYEYLPLHGTYGSANVTLYNGLSKNFTFYQGPFIGSYQEYVDGNEMLGVEAYFRERGQKYDISDEVTIGTFMGLGFMLLDSGHAEVAIDLLLNAIKERFPESLQLYRVLGRAYMKMENKDKTIRAYEMMALKAKQQNHPELERFESTLKRVKQHMNKLEQESK